MAKKKTFRVYAKVITYAYIDIEAETAEDAEAEANELDGGDFISNEIEDGGDFIVAPENKPTHKVQSSSEIEKGERYYDVHVQINRKTGYSILIKISTQDSLSDDEVVAECVKQGLFSEAGDEEYVDSVDELEEDEYKAMKNI